MSVYLDASFLVALFVNQTPLSARATAFLETTLPELVVSDFAGAEFASAIAQRVQATLATFDATMARNARALGLEVAAI